MLDHRLEEFNSTSVPDSSQSEPIAVSPQPQPAPKKPQPTTQKSFSWLRRGWDNLGFRSKLTLLLVGGATIPVLIVTQSLININKARTIDDLKRTLQLQGQTFANEYVLWTQVDTETQAENIAKVIQATEVDLNNPAQVTARQQFLKDYLVINENQENPELTKSFKILTDAQGRTVAQNIIINEDSINTPALPASNQEIKLPKYRRVSIPVGTSITDIPIVKNALATGRPLSGIELVKSQSLQKLGLAPQANLGLRTQPIRNLPEAKKPAPEGTYDVDGGKAGLMSMAVHPIKINNRLVGTVVIGTLLNRNYGLVDKFSQTYNVPVATVFAKDWRVVTNVPYIDGKSRAVGTRVSREVTEKVLNQEQEFVGEANIIGRQYLTYYSPLYDHQQELNPDAAQPVGMAFVGESLSEVEVVITRQQLIAYSIGGSILLFIGLVSIPIASSFSRPMRRLSNFAQEVAAGNEQVLLDVSDDRYDEIGILSKEMNAMAQSIAANLEARRQEADRAQILKDITVRLSQSVDSQTTLKVAVEEIRAAIKSDRVVVYSFDQNWKGTVTFESVAEGFPQALNAQINDPCFAEGYVNKYRRGRVQATADIRAAGLTDCHIQQLEQFAVKANLVAPIVTNGELVALLIAHQCSAPRIWQQNDVDLFAQLAAQVGSALDRVSLLEQQKAAKEQLQRRALELLMEVDPLTKGDLTIRASVTEDEIGTIADSYNATISSLRQIVNQVQTAAEQVAFTTTTKESSVSELSQEARRQTEEIAAAVAQIQEMANLVRAVATNAAQAEAAVQQATQTVSEGDNAMNRTVDGILAIRETVAQTSKKVKRLGESSQKISKVVNLIGMFADQTNLLALNAAIEAANAGEQGRGFAVVAERVRSLARQSTEATTEIEKLVTDIQTETNEVGSAMEAGTEQVVAGTRLVDETRQSLNKISEVSNQINELVKAIATATVDQSKASEEVTQTMSDVAQIANKTSTEATQVSASFKELLAVAQQLQASASQFKVN